ncbi:MAG: LEA type 2 family protein [Woeseiaceae bacterium]
MKYAKSSLLLCVCVVLSACATTKIAINPPVVSLRAVDVTEVDFSAQTFLLRFDVTNPNSFALPINYVHYGVKLDGQRFASGESVASFSVPANSDSDFAISVDLNLFRTAPQLLYTFRDGATRDLSYELSGEFGIDIPFVNSVPFEYNGEIRLRPLFVTRATNRSND